MGGGLMQLVAYGAQDIYLTGNPQITFFKVVYRRHTNFAVESIEQTFNGTPDFNKYVTATISRNGDLIQQMYLEVVLPQVTGSSSVAGSNVWVYGVGNALIQKAEIEIGGQLIDRHYAEWLDIWTELSVPTGKRVGYDDMVGNVLGGVDATTAAVRLYVPLQFWFNRNPGLALPLIALQYHEVKLNVQFNPAASLFVQDAGQSVTVPTAVTSIKLYVDYVYLDTDERRRFAQVSHEYLIEQVQFTGDESVASGSSSKNFTLNFNHPCKELIWVHRLSTLAQTGPTVGTEVNNFFNFSSVAEAMTASTGADTFSQGKLQLNGHDRFTIRYADYFRKVQNYEHHTRVPRTLGEYCVIAGSADSGYRQQYIYTYSFALSPEEHQPSGTCNFSRIDNAVLQLTYSSPSARVLKVFAVNYNVLRIMSGMGGLAYSN
jgi:hypothetical protein